ncbi:outer membrane lipoprotein-sorting protein, partial [bacterium]|nr:outer membrane lipoprotein-sorting protein [bacterium]
ITVIALAEMLRPITLTTFTTIAGFMGLYLSSLMPPFKFLGLFSAFGVFVAWLYSITLLPACLSLMKLNPIQKIEDPKKKAPDYFSTVMSKVGIYVIQYPKSVVILFVLLIGLSTFQALAVIVNEDRIETFDHREDIYLADKVINQYFDGTNNLDIMIETKDPEDLYQPHYLRKIDQLQNFIETLPTVGGSTSLVDTIQQMYKSLNENKQEFYRIPDSSDLVAQLFLIYSASNSPTDFEDKVDYDYQKANIRVQLKSGLFSENKKLIDQVQVYIEEHFNEEGISAYISGRVNLNYHWIKNIGKSHFKSVAVSLLLVGLMAMFVFSSVLAGLYSLIPVVISILVIYAVMGSFEINLGIGTSMFASVAIGLGVDFSIHTIDQIKSLFKESNSSDFDQTISKFFPSTGRALFFNFLAISMGFGVLKISKVDPLFRFGGIVALSVSVSFLSSLVLIPALIKVFRPNFIMNQDSPMVFNKKLVAGIVILLAMTSSIFSADILPNARQLITKVNHLEEGQWVSRKLKMTMIDRRGKKRVREAIGYRKYYLGTKKTYLYYVSPSNIKRTSFLTFDYLDNKKEDDQWLYLPAMRKARRISSSDRGDYFLGTDFTYEDIKKEGKIEIEDYHFKTLALVELNGKKLVQIEALAKSEKIAKELGHNKQHLWIDPLLHVIVKSKSWDTNGNFLKTLNVSDISLVDGILTRHTLIIENHKSKHKTIFQFSHVDYKKEVKDKIFSKSSLRKGVKW